MRLPKPGTIEIAPSILSADFARLADEIEIIRRSGLQIVHIDVMDGHFVPNITIGPPVVASIRACTELVLDCHLMISNPEKYVPEFIKAGADHVTFHAEATENGSDLISLIHDAGCTAGVCIKPDTPVSAIDQIAPLCEMVLVMTVHPGFGGQTLITEATEKAAQIRRITGPDVRIEVDGGINPDTVEMVVSKGFDTLIAGSAIFANKDRIASIEALRQACL